MAYVWPPSEHRLALQDWLQRQQAAGHEFPALLRADFLDFARTFPGILLVWNKDPDGHPTAPLLLQATAQQTTSTLVAVLVPPVSGRDLTVLRRAGVRLLAPVAADEIIATAEELAAGRNVSDAASRAADFQRIIRSAAAAGDLRNVSTLATSLGVSYRTLCRWTTAGGWPSPRRLLAEARELRTTRPPLGRPSQTEDEGAG